MGKAGGEWVRGGEINTVLLLFRLHCLCFFGEGSCFCFFSCSFNLAFRRKTQYGEYMVYFVVLSRSD